MSRSLLAAMIVLGGQAAGRGAAPVARAALPDGVYAVRREGLKDKDVRPLKGGEVLVVHRHRYVKKDKGEPPRYLVVSSAPEVPLDLAAEPKGVKEGAEVVRILLKLKPKAAAALERLTRDRLGRQVAVVVGGEVVTTHKVREVIKGGEVQVTSCAPGAAGYLLKRLQTRPEGK